MAWCSKLLLVLRSNLNVGLAVSVENWQGRLIMSAKYSKESVLVVARRVIDELCPMVFCREVKPVKTAVLTNHQFLTRDLVEHDFNYKQVIPYVLIRHENRYLLIRRTTKQTEARLHDLYSLGIGGHINNEDVSGGNGDVILSGMRRELEEEIKLEAEGSCELIGIINDDSTEVARVHLGFVFLLNTPSPAYTIVEEDKYTASWKLPEEISQYYERMESWAQIVHDFVLYGDSPDRAKKWFNRGSSG